MTGTEIHQLSNGRRKFWHFRSSGDYQYNLFRGGSKIFCAGVGVGFFKVLGEGRQTSLSLSRPLFSSLLPVHRLGNVLHLGSQDKDIPWNAFY